MAWRDDLRKVQIGGRELIAASFRGVPFYVESAERGGGRRTVTHEFPFRDRPFVEDLGRKARSFSVEGYVLGPGYMAAKAALVQALEERGPGTLVHPYYGDVQAICSELRVRESTSEGGIARFGLTFEETTETAPMPAATVAASAVLQASADAAAAAVEEEFAETYLVDDLPPSALESLIAAVEEAAAAIDEALGPFIAAAEAAAALKRDLDRLVLKVESIIRKPFQVIGDMKRAFDALAEGPLLPSLGLRGLIAMAGFGPSGSRPPGTTGMRRREQACWDALVGAIRGLAIVTACRVAVAEEFDSYDAAVAARDAIVERIDELLETAGDTAFAALIQLRADLVRAIPGEESDLPRLVAHVPDVTVPSLVLAHRLYGDVDLEGDLVARNRIARPGFVVGGTRLEVLSRG